MCVYMRARVPCVHVLHVHAHLSGVNVYVSIHVCIVCKCVCAPVRVGACV